MSESTKVVVASVPNAWANLRRLTAAMVVAAGPTPQAVDSSKKPRVMCVVQELIPANKFNNQKRISVSIVGVTSEYDETTDIKDGDGSLLAHVDKEADVMTLYTVTTAQHLKDKSSAEVAKYADGTSKIKIQENLCASRLLKNGDFLTLAYDSDNFNQFERFNRITLALRASYYCKYDEKTDSWNYGVSMRASDGVVKEKIGALQMFHLFLKNPSGFKPLPAPADLIANEGYVASPQTVNKLSRASIVVPLNWPEFDIPMSAQLVMRKTKTGLPEPLYWKDKKDGTLKRKFAGELQVFEWESFDAMMANLADTEGQGRYIVYRTVVEFCFFNDWQPFKIDGIDLFSYFAPKLVGNGGVPMVFDAKVKFSKTASHQFNAPDAPDPFVRFYNVNNPTTTYDFVEYLRMRAFPMCREAVLKLLQTNDARLHSFSTGIPEMQVPRVRINRDQKQDKDNTYFLLNEWSSDSRDPVIRGAAGERFEYYALPCVDIKSGGLLEKALLSFPKWRAENPNYKGPLADMIFCAEWQPREGDAYCELIGAKQAIPDNHPFIGVENFVPDEPEAGAFDRRQFLLYAVDPSAYADQLSPPKKTVQAIEAPKKREAATISTVEENGDDDDDGSTSAHSKSRARFDEPEIDEE